MDPRVQRAVSPRASDSASPGRATDGCPERAAACAAQLTGKAPRRFSEDHAAALAEAHAHFADHGASCHGNDGKGQTEIGQRLYPKAPDMTASDTQRLSDGELFSIIRNGVRFTGMPAWGADAPEDDRDSWRLVHFIHRLSTMTPQEIEQMKSMNPVSPAGLQEEKEIENFLEGENNPDPTKKPKRVH